MKADLAAIEEHNLRLPFMDVTGVTRVQSTTPLVLSFMNADSLSDEKSQGARATFMIRTEFSGGGW